MHISALNYGKLFFETYLSSDISSELIIVDVGAQDVNGSLRQFAPLGSQYVGVDFVAGVGVDVVLKDPYTLPFETGSVDAVVCSSVYEHSEFFWLLFLESLRILKPTGLLYLNAPSNGAVHRYPTDSWRFYPDAGKSLVNWARRNGMCAILLESFIGKKSGDIKLDGMWNDFVAVVARDENHLPKNIVRMINGESGVHSAYLNGLELPAAAAELTPDLLLIEDQIDELVKLRAEIDGLKKIIQADEEEKNLMKSTIKFERSEKERLRNEINDVYGIESVSRKSNVCVIIPYYNGSHFIERALNSVFSQTIQADEVIVVNDGSVASEAEFLHALAKNFKIKVLDKDNGGQGSARNYGVANSCSKYISFLDQDDFYLKRHIEDLLAAIPRDEPNFGFVYGDLHEADGDGNLIRIGMIKTHSSHPKVHINNLISQDMFILPSASLIARDAYLAVGGFDSQFTGYEDDDLFLRIFRAGYSNNYLDKPVTTWCIHQGSTSYSVKMCRSRFRYLKKLVAMFPDDPGSSRFYFRDLIVPRFHSLIINDAVNYKINNIPGVDEVIGILGGYIDLFVSNPYISYYKKIKMRIMRFVLVRSGDFSFKIAYKLRHIKNNL